jgi:hypothetical protein
MSTIIVKPIFGATRRAVRFAIVVIMFTMGSFDTKAQSAAETAEAEIRKLEADQVSFLMKGEVSQMKENWSPDYTVNNPFNVVQHAATGPIQTGNLTYTKFEREIEKVLYHGSVVVVMGSELVVPKTAPKGSSHDTDQPIKRRFTNVWMQKDGKWLMIARHASNICSN